VKQFRVTNERLNAYGFWVKTSGIDLSDFQENPVMLKMHQRWDGMPIGRWEGITVQGDEILMTPVFDDEDEDALKVKRKVERGFLKAASIGIEILEVSDELSMLKPGQRRPTVTKSKLLEVSIVDIPANGAAVSLYKRDQEGKLVCLNASKEGEIDVLLPVITKQPMKAVNFSLGLPEDAKEEAILAAITALKGQAKQGGDTPASVILALKSQLDGVQAKLANFDTRVSELLGAAKGGAGTQSTGREDWTFSDWEQKDPKGLAKLSQEKPEQFYRLVEESYEGKKI
jgi:hypothetical protein